jgi:hypothetical protein
MSIEQLARAGATPEDERRYRHDAGERYMRQASSQLLARGWPDVVILTPYGTLFLSLKAETGEPTGDQAYVLKCLARAGCDVAIWRPQELWSGEIEAQLDALAGRWQGNAITIKCEICHRLVTADSIKKRYCSAKCRSTAARRRAAGTA